MSRISSTIVFSERRAADCALRASEEEQRAVAIGLLRRSSLGYGGWTVLARRRLSGPKLSSAGGASSSRTARYSQLTCFYSFLLLASLAATRFTLAQESPPTAPPAETEGPVVVLTGASSDRRAGELLDAALERFGIRVLRTLDSLFLTAPAGERPMVAIVRGQGFPQEAPQRLQTFLTAGGHLVLLGAVDPTIAAVAGLEGSPVPAETAGRMAVISVNVAQFGPAPASVIQFPSAAVRYQPVPSDASATERSGADPIGKWLSLTGESLEVPAVLMTPSGAALSAEPALGDREGWAWLLLAIIGRCDPKLFGHVLSRQIEGFGHLSRFTEYGSLITYLSQAVQAPAASPEARQRLTQATADFARAQALLEQKDAKTAAEALRSARGALVSAYIGAMPSRPGEVRAIFSAALPAESWPDVIRAVGSSGLNTLFIHSGTAAVAYYPSTVIPRAPEAMLGDPLGEVVAAAATSSIRVFAWHEAFRLAGADPAAVEAFQKDQRLMVSVRGSTLDWLCPLNPANQALEESVVRELAARPGVRGILLDFLRYPNANYCYCPMCRAAFEGELGRSVGRWPQDVVVGPLREAYRQFRARSLTRVLQALAAAAREAKPDVVLCVTAFPDPTAAEGVGQDWPEWARGDLVDAICLLSYEVPPGELEDRLGDLRRQMTGRTLLLAGLRTSSSGRLPPEPVEVADAVAAVRRAGADGFFLYSYDRAETWEVLPALGAGPTRLPATPPYDSPPVHFALLNPDFSDDGAPAFNEASTIHAQVSAPGTDEISGDLWLEALAGGADQPLGGAHIGAGPLDVSFRAPQGRFRLSVHLTRGDSSIPSVVRGPVFRVEAPETIAQLKAERERRLRIDVGIVESGRGARALWQALEGLDDPRIRPEFLTSITPETLARYDVLVVSDPDPPWTQAQEVIQRIREWVIAGGSVLAVHDAVGMGGNPPLFPEVGEPRPEGRSRSVQVEPRVEGDPLLEGIRQGQQFSPRHPEHVVMRRGALGRDLLVDVGTSEPGLGTLVAGPLGEGRVVLCGLALGLGPRDEELPPIREELLLLRNAVRWLGRAEEKGLPTEEP